MSQQRKADLSLIMVTLFLGCILLSGEFVP